MCAYFVRSVSLCIRYLPFAHRPASFSIIQGLVAYSCIGDVPAGASTLSTSSHRLPGRIICCVLSELDLALLVRIGHRQNSVWFGLSDPLGVVLFACCALQTPGLFRDTRGVTVHLSTPSTLTMGGLLYHQSFERELRSLCLVLSSGVHRCDGKNRSRLSTDAKPCLALLLGIDSSASQSEFKALAVFKATYPVAAAAVWL